MSALSTILAQAWPVLPVLVIDNPEQAVPLASALQQGGIKVIEVTLRSSVALEAISRICHSLPELVVGAGTVTTASQLLEAQQVGAQFAVSPGFTVQLAQTATDIQLPWLPGVLTASEIMQAQALGYHQLKLFPACGQRGLELLDSYFGPFADVSFCPTVGVNTENLSEFLQRAKCGLLWRYWLAPAIW